MKKIFVAAMAIIALGAVNANAQVNTKASEDSVSRQFGKMMGESLKANPNFNVNTPEFIKGINQIVKSDTSNTSYISGLEFGLSLLQQVRKAKESDNLTIDKDLFAQELIKALNDTTKLSREQLMNMGNKFNEDMKRVSTITKGNTPTAIKNKKDGADYISNLLKTDKTYKKTASGLVYKMVADGKGENFKATDKIRMKYKGTHVDGTVFDEAKDTISMDPARVIPGFKEALLLMKPGSKLIAVIPQDLAYGPQGAGDAIKPFETIVFTLEAYGVEQKAADKPAANSKKATK